MIHSGLISAATKNSTKTDFAQSTTFEVTTSDEHVVLPGQIGDQVNASVLQYLIRAEHLLGSFGHGKP